MVKVHGPALSLEASGSLGGVVVFSRWKGRPYVRSLVVPHNPRSSSQVGVRAMFKFLSQQWASLTGIAQATWEERAAGLNASPFNAYMSGNQYRWRDFLAPGMQDPVTDAGTSPTLGTLAAVAAGRGATITQPITAAGTGWGIAFFRGATSGFSTSWGNLIGIGLVVSTANVVWVDSPLSPGAYYWKVRSFCVDGKLGAESASVTVTIT